MKFLADMGISLRTVSWLRGGGYDAVHLRIISVSNETFRVKRLPI